MVGGLLVLLLAPFTIPTYKKVLGRCRPQTKVMRMSAAEALAW